MANVEFRFELTKAYYRCLQIRQDYSLSHCDPRAIIMCALAFEDCVASCFLRLGGITSINCHRLIPLDDLIRLPWRGSINVPCDNVQPFFDMAAECAIEKRHRVAGTEHLLSALLACDPPFRDWARMLSQSLDDEISALLDMRIIVQRFLDHAEYPEFASGSFEDRGVMMAALDWRTQSAKIAAIDETIYFANVIAYCKSLGEV